MAVNKITVAVRAIGFVAVCLATLMSPAMAQEEADDQMQMVLDFLADSDREMRAIGLQVVREGEPGEEATKKFAEQLPKISPAGQADLMDALASRGDVAARPAIVALMESEDAKVRAAVIRALGFLGNAEDVAALVGTIARGSESEKKLARASLVKLPDKTTNSAIITAMTDGDSADQAELLAILAGRNAKETIPEVLEYSEARVQSVRLAAMNALRTLAGEEQAPRLVEMLKKAKPGAEKQKAELALLAVCGTVGESSAATVIAGIEGSDPATRAALLRALARTGGAEALKTVAAAFKDEDAQVADQAARTLAGWGEGDVESHLREMAAGDNRRHKTLALRGLLRLAEPGVEKPANMELLAEVMKLADRPADKLLVVGSYSRLDDPESLKQVVAAMDIEELADGAALAVVGMAERIATAGDDAEKTIDNEQLKAALQKAKSATKSQPVIDRAAKALESLK